MQSPQPGDVLAYPREQDVVSTRSTGWNRHPPNAFYRELVARAATTLKGEKDLKTIPRAAERIADIIMVDKGGVFVKLENVKGEWVVMQRRDVLIKIQQAIRNYQSKIKNGGKWHVKARGPSRKKKKKSTKVKQKAVSRELKKQITRREISYQAQAGEEASIHPYALKLISAVCNAPNPRTALNVLNAPFIECFIGEGEPSMERAMRLQLRHRYAGALAMNISPISFSKDLLAFWGGKLVEKEIPQQQETEAPAPCPSNENEQNDNESSAAESPVLSRRNSSASEEDMSNESSY